MNLKSKQRPSKCRNSFWAPLQCTDEALPLHQPPRSWAVARLRAIYGCYVFALFRNVHTGVNK